MQAKPSAKSITAANTPAAFIVADWQKAGPERCGHPGPGHRPNRVPAQDRPVNALGKLYRCIAQQIDLEQCYGDLNRYRRG